MLILDIETGAQPEDKLVFPTFEAPPNYKSPEAIANNLAKQKADYIAKAALNELSGKIVAVGILDTDDDKFDFIAETLPFEEKNIIEWTWRVLANPVAVVTFNGTDFDFPMLIRRSWILGIPVPSWVFHGEFISDLISGHDVRRLWNFRDRHRSGGLDAIAGAFCFAPKTFSGEKFYSVLLDNYELAKEYSKGDLDRTLAIYNRIVGGVK